MEIVLDKPCCDQFDNCTNNETVREWIHDTYKFLYHEDVTDDGLNKLSNQELADWIDELDWLASK